MKATLKIKYTSGLRGNCDSACNMLALFSALLLIHCISASADFEAVPQTTCACVDSHSSITVSKSDCVLKCLASPTCRSFRFNESTSECEMSTSRDGCFNYLPENSTLYRKSGSEPTNSTKCLVQKRYNSAVSFERSWSDYVNGFGDKTNFWLGLDRLHQLTSGNVSVTMSVLSGINGKYYKCKYLDFTVKGPTDGYAMNYSKYQKGSVNFGDSMLASRGAEFATFDFPVGSPGQACSEAYGNSGWWFGSGDNCSEANPNGIFDRNGDISDIQYMGWFGATGQWEPLQMSQIYLHF